MSTTRLQKINAGQKFLLVHVAGVLQYAQHNKDFTDTLAATILAQNWQPTVAQVPLPSFRYVYPYGQSDALSTARWLIQTLQTHPEYLTARSTLARWAQNRKAPQDLVLGVVGLAIIGPTLGIISSKKKKKRSSQLLIEQSYFKTLCKEELLALALQLTQRVVAAETRLVGGNIYNLHPDTATWCLEEALSKTYIGSHSDLNLLFNTSVTENLSHSAQKDDRGNIQALVISPSVNDSLVDESGAEKI